MKCNRCSHDFPADTRSHRVELCDDCCGDLADEAIADQMVADCAGYDGFDRMMQFAIECAENSTDENDDHQSGPVSEGDLEPPF